MKQVITEKDIKNLQGKFIVQLNDRHDEPCMANEFRKNPGFWLEKRISFVGCIYNWDGAPHLKPKESLIILNGLYYCHGIYTKEAFIEYFNDYVWDRVERNETHKGERYHRLLTNKEMDWLNEELKKN